jgi:abortive infection bacteriophage resistance protein
MKRRLSVVSYYRLSGYWFPFRLPNDDFRAGTHFDTIWMHYMFDRRLRLLVMDAIERIEVAVRTQWAYHHSQAHGAFGYANDPSALPGLDTAALEKLQQTWARDKWQNRKERFVAHFETKYGEHHDALPVWMAIEVMSFGTTLTAYKGSSHGVKQRVASTFDMPAEVFESWLLALNTVRNICAHHSRLWNRDLGVKPKMPRPREYPDWSSPVLIGNSRVFCILSICHYCLGKVAPHSEWRARLIALFASFPDVPLRSLGIPDNWTESPIWRYE